MIALALDTASLSTQSFDATFLLITLPSNSERAVNQSQISPKRLPGDIAVVVPAYNVGDRLGAVLDGLLAVVSTVIVVDDGSTDGCTGAAKNRPVDLIAFDHNQGKGHALVAGYKKALEHPDVQCVAVVDADGQHDPRELPRLYDAVKQHDADFVIGAREFGTGNVPLRSRFGNMITISLSAVLLGTRVRDTQSGYRVLSRRFLEDVLPGVTGGRYDTEMELLGKAIGGGYKVTSVPIQTIYEEGNVSSHFHKIRDSYLIYRTLFATAWKARLRKR